MRPDEIEERFSFGVRWAPEVSRYVLSVFSTLIS
jgi:hypothetical protein